MVRKGNLSLVPPTNSEGLTRTELRVSLQQKVQWIFAPSAL
jgi:hypothetical protein